VGTEEEGLSERSSLTLPVIPGRDEVANPESIDPLTLPRDRFRARAKWRAPE